MTFCLNSIIIKPENDTEIKNAIILLHGYGGDGKDISVISNNWKRHLPNTVFICPNGHEICPINPSGFQWFDLTKDDPEYILQESKKAEKKLDKFINEVKITDIKTGETIDSFNGSINDINVPLRSIKNEDGIQFIKSKEQNLRLKFPDGTNISKTSERNYAVEYSDGTQSNFVKDSEHNIVGSSTDGSATIKFSSGKSIHRTTEGIIIEETSKGNYRLYQEKEGSITQIQSREEIAGIEGISSSLFDKLIVIEKSMEEITEPTSDSKRLAEIREQIDIVKRAEESSEDPSNKEVSERILNDIKTPRVAIDSDPIIEKDNQIEIKDPDTEASFETREETTRDTINTRNEDSVVEEEKDSKDRVVEDSITENERREPQPESNPEITQEPVIEDRPRENTSTEREPTRSEPTRSDTTDSDQRSREAPSEENNSRSRSRY